MTNVRLYSGQSMAAGLPHSDLRSTRSRENSLRGADEDTQWR